MIVVIQCAASKRPDAGFLRRGDGRPVAFVADPALAPASERCVYARPDDPADDGVTWRKALVRYNQDPGGNPLGLLPAFQLYEHPVYRQLADRFGIGNTYILSAGWGLLAAGFLTPYYDITFSPAARKQPHKRRKPADSYEDLSMLPPGLSEPVVFFGGKDYVPLFCSLTSAVRAPKLLFYNSAQPPQAPGCLLERFETSTRTNWHYECASAFTDGRIDLSQAARQALGSASANRG